MTSADSMGNLIDAVIEAVKKGEGGVNLVCKHKSGAELVIHARLDALISADGEVLFKHEDSEYEPE